MAISGGDGSIILSTKVDTAGAKQGFKQITGLAGKAFLAIGVAATTATVAITKMAVSAYADYEQLVGGIETLFKGSSDKMLKYAKESFRTTGLSANEYMANVTSFSASLISSLGGDTEKAAEVANQAMISMADNANKMGTPIENVQTAFQGFAKQQYMLLDNLKLGYGGTKTEMERLLKDAEAYLATQGKNVKFNINNLADVYTAVEAIQQKLGITGTTAKEAEKTISGSLAMMKASWKDVLTAIGSGEDLDQAIDNLVYSISVAFNNLAPAVERSLIGIGQLIERVAPLLVQTVVSSIIKSIPNLIVAIYNMVIGMAKGIFEGIKALFSGGTKTVEKQVEETSSGIGVATDNMEALGDATEEAGKKAKKSLAGFDDLQILTSQSAENTAEIATADMGIASVTSDAEETGDTDTSKFTSVVDVIKDTLSSIMSAVTPALIAVGFLLLCFGAILPGLGLISAGAVMYMANDTMTSDNPAETAKQYISILKDLIVPALFFMGVLLLFLGMIPLGIGLIVAGAFIIGYKEVQNSEYDTASLQDKINVILQIISVALIAIGVIMIFFGIIPLGLGFVIAGAVLFNITKEKLDENAIPSKISKFIEDNRKMLIGVAAVLIVIAIILFATGVGIPLALGLMVAGGAILATSLPIDWGYVKDKITNFMKENEKLIVGVSLALILIGVILMVTGVGIPIGLAMIVAGAGILVAEAKLNDKSIPDMITDFLDNNKGIIVGVSYALLLLGIILLFTGVGIPLAIGLILAGGGILATEVALNWDFIVDKVKEIWQKIKDFWNQHIAPIFTAEWWKNLGKKALNGLISIFETGINYIISKINEFVKGIDAVISAVGDIFGADWSIAQIPKVKIPRLAKGAVLPGGKPFLAMLGDQPAGQTNIEAPAELIKQMTMEALMEVGASGMTTKEEHYYLDKTELMSIVYKLVKGGERLAGESLVKGV